MNEKLLILKIREESNQMALAMWAAHCLDLSPEVAQIVSQLSNFKITYQQASDMLNDIGK